MARIWIEPAYGVLGNSKVRTTSYGAAAAVAKEQQVICVHVCSFTFRFTDEDEIREYISLFEKPSHSSAAVGSDRWHAQTWYEPLPPYLMEDDKRAKVLKALHEAIEMLHATHA